MRTVLTEWPEEFFWRYGMGLHTDLLSLSLKYTQQWKTNKNLCMNKHQPSSPSCFTLNTKSEITKRRFLGTLFCSCWK